MKHIEEIQIAGTALLLCGAMFAVSASQRGKYLEGSD